MANENENSKEVKALIESELTRKPIVMIPKYDVHRDVLRHETVMQSTGYSGRDKSIPAALRQCVRSWSILGFIAGCVPILQWLPKYSIRRDIFGDIMAGFTVAIMNIPHGMAYGILAGVQPECGLYMAIFPTIVYMILGTSRHISIGTFAVISMMTLKVVQSVATTDESVINPTADYGDGDVITPIQVVTVLALTVGLIHIAMGFLRLGALSALLSDPLVSGFTSGAAVHVATSQLKDFLGVTIARRKGAFKIIYTLIDLGKSIPNVNVANLIFCTAVMCFMTLCNEVLKPYLRKFCRMPLPGELIAVIGGTLISMWLNVNEVYGIKLVGKVPDHLPTPELPRFELIPRVAVDSIAIAIVSFSVVMSMGLPFAKKHAYEVRANQELFAIGVANCLSGFFSCIPLGCSLSRSVIQEQTGGKTQIASLVSATLIIMTVLWAGPFFSELPKCVLAGVIIVALKPLFMQVKDLKKFSRQGKMELASWIFTFFLVVIIDIDIGLLIGIGVSVLALYIKGVKPYSTLLGTLPQTEAVYVDLATHINAIELRDIKIFRYTGSINFATYRSFATSLYRAIGYQDSKNLSKNKKKISKSKKSKHQDDIEKQYDQEGGDAAEEEEEHHHHQQQQQQQQQNDKIQIQRSNDNVNGNRLLLTTSIDNNVDDDDDNDDGVPALPLRCLVLDFSMVGHIDVAGCHTITEILKEMASNGVRLFIGAPSDCVYDSLVHSMALGEGPFDIFPTLHDAVLYATACRTL